MSRGPISTRSGIPFLIHSHPLAPPISRSSISTSSCRLWYFFSFSSLARLSVNVITSILSFAFLIIGISTTCEDATFGGSMIPSSSPCVMTRPPIRRVDEPHEVVQAYSSVSWADWNLISEALAKFCPKKCEVPAWSPFLSCIMASMHKVSTAPGNLSAAVFLPLITGMAIYSSAARA